MVDLLGLTVGDSGSCSGWHSDARRVRRGAPVARKKGLLSDDHTVAVESSTNGGTVIEQWHRMDVDGRDSTAQVHAEIWLTKLAQAYYVRGQPTGAEVKRAPIDDVNYAYLFPPLAVEMLREFARLDRMWDKMRPLDAPPNLDSCLPVQLRRPT
jgi:hypothetical protein